MNRYLLIFVTLLAITGNAYADSISCGWANRSLAGASVGYDDNVVNCTFSASVTKNLSIGAFGIAPTDMNDWDQIGEVDVWTSYSLDNVTLSTGVYLIADRPDTIFSSIRFNPAVYRWGKLTVSPTTLLQVKWKPEPDEFSLVLEPGVGLTYEVSDQTSCNVSPRYRYNTAGEDGWVAPYGCSFKLDEQWTISPGGETRCNPVTKTCDHAAKLGVSYTFK